MENVWQSCDVCLKDSSASRRTEKASGPYPLVLSNTLKPALKGEPKRFFGIDEGILNILRAGKHLCLDD